MAEAGGKRVVCTFAYDSHREARLGFRRSSEIGSGPRGEAEIRYIAGGILCSTAG